MKQQQNSHSRTVDSWIVTFVQGIDRDVERGEDRLMLGLAVVMLSSTLAPIFPPSILLPLMAITFAISVAVARRNYQRIEQKLKKSLQQLDGYELSLLHPIVKVFKDHPAVPLALSFNPLKNVKRTLRSFLGGLLINPLWMPIFYMMGTQIDEEKNLALLNKAIIAIERKILPTRPVE